MLHFISISAKCYKLNNDLQLKNVEDQDLYRNNDDLQFFFKQKVLIFWFLKIYILRVTL